MPQKQRKNGERESQRMPSRNDDLKSREYRGPDGELHHHTRKFMAQHAGAATKKRNGRQ